MRRRIMRRHILAALALIGLAACQPAEKSAAPDAGQLILYTARHYDADLKLYEAFTAKTGITVNRLEMSPDQLIERMRAEGDQSLADVILMADAGALYRAQAAGLFQPTVTPALTAAIPAHLREPTGLWWGFSRRARIFAYDKAAVSPADLASYESLADPKFRKGVCVRSSDNVYNLSLMSALIERWGRDKALTWARGVVANMARPPSGGDIDQIKAVSAGACKVALTNTYYYLRLATSGDAGDKAVIDKVALAFPEQGGDGAHVNISGGGVAAHAGNRDNAIKFLEFLATPEAQAIFAGANNEYPAVEGSPLPPPVAAYANFKADDMPVDVYGRRQAEAQSVFDQAGWR